MDIFRRFAGMVCLELVSAKLERTILILNAEGIELYDYHQKDCLTVRFWISRSDLSAALKICSRLEGNTRILEKRGLYWTMRAAVARPVLLLGIIVIMILYWYVPSRIFFVRVEGNSMVPSRQILAEAESCGIRFGASREAVRSASVKNRLIEKIPQIQWAGVNTVGCVATISVRERQQMERIPESNTVSSLAASRDGYILTAIATKGSLLVQPGQTVKEGQILISGFTDCGIIIRAERAEGEIYAQTNRRILVVAPTVRYRNHCVGPVRKKISLLLGKKRIILWKDSGISVDSCGRMYEEYYVTLPGGFSLPTAICVESYKEYRYDPILVSPEEWHSPLSDTARQYLQSQMTGGTILKAEEDFSAAGQTVVLNGDYVCQEMISGVRLEQIGETNGKSD